MSRLLLPALAFAAVWTAGFHVEAHGFGTTPIWNREVSRIVYDKCASCHRPGGSSFSLMTYMDAQPRAEQIAFDQPWRDRTVVVPLPTQPVPDPAKDAVYICPMDPDVRSRHPGTCSRESARN